MPNVHFDGRELVALTRDIQRAAAIAHAEAAKVVTKAAVNIKNDAKQRVTGLAHAPRYPYSITFDPVQIHRTGAQTDVGPDKDRRQGDLGNILEYGTIRNPPHPHMLPAGEVEAPRFARAMEDLAAEAFES